MPFPLHKVQGADIVSFANPSCEGGGTTWQHQARTNLTAITCSEGLGGFSSTRAIPDKGSVIDRHVPLYPSSQILCSRKKGQEPLKPAVPGLPKKADLHAARILLGPAPASTYAQSSQWVNKLQFSCALSQDGGIGMCLGWSRSSPSIVEIWR